MNGIEFRDARDNALFERTCENAKEASSAIARGLEDVSKISDVNLKDHARKIIKAVLTAAIDKL